MPVPRRRSTSYRETVDQHEVVARAVQLRKEEPRFVGSDAEAKRDTSGQAVHGPGRSIGKPVEQDFRPSFQPSRGGQVDPGPSGREVVPVERRHEHPFIPAVRPSGPQTAGVGICLPVENGRGVDRLVCDVAALARDRVAETIASCCRPLRYLRTIPCSRTGPPTATTLSFPRWPSPSTICGCSRSDRIPRRRSSSRLPAIRCTAIFRRKETCWPTRRTSRADSRSTSRQCRGPIGITVGHPRSCIRDDCPIGTLIPIHDFLTLRDDLFRSPGRRLRPNRSLQRNFPRFVQATT